MLVFIFSFLLIFYHLYNILVELIWFDMFALVVYCFLWLGFWFELQSAPLLPPAFVILTSASKTTHMPTTQIDDFHIVPFCLSDGSHLLDLTVFGCVAEMMFCLFRWSSNQWSAHSRKVFKNPTTNKLCACVCAREAKENK